MDEALVLRLRRTTGTVLNTGVLPQRHRSSHHSKAWQREAGKADDAANPTVLQRAAQERSCAEEKPAGAERTRSESSHGAMRSCGAEQSVGACGGRKADFSKSCEELQNSKERAQRDENFA